MAAPPLRRALLVAACALLVVAGGHGAAAASAGFLAAAPLQPSVAEDALHAEMRTMMSDDTGDDDDINAALSHGSGGLLQVNDGGSGRADAANAPYLQDSAAALSEALGSRWDGHTLETDARQKTSALLEGIAGHQALGSLNSLMGAMTRVR
mmetsp:Transcript_132717/g.296888  ORF Transcript_132717/g.296888 Transcript_132717/m.296888 type:complete len:152 (+) Transcript_132717:81-536(+)